MPVSKSYVYHRIVPENIGPRDFPNFFEMLIMEVSGCIYHIHNF